eukprot:287929_1
MTNKYVRKCPICSYVFKDIKPQHHLCPVDGYNPLKHRYHTHKKKFGKIKNERWPEVTKLVQKFNMIRKMPHCKYDPHANNCNTLKKWVKNCGIMQRIKFILIEYQKYISNQQQQNTNNTSNKPKNKTTCKGYMQITTKYTNKFQLKYVYFDKKLYYGTNPQEIHSKNCIDLSNIDDIYIYKNKMEIILFEDTKKWIIRLNDNKLFEKLINSIKNEWNEYKLTLNKFMNILSRTTSQNRFLNYFINDPYTITNLLDDYIHCLDTHKDELQSTIKNNNTNICDLSQPNRCKSYHRHCRNRTNDDWKNQQFILKTFNTDCEYEIYLQSIFDEIHCSLLHFNDRCDETEKNHIHRRYNTINRCDEKEDKVNICTDINTDKSDKYYHVDDPMPIQYEVGTKKCYSRNNWTFDCLKDEMIEYGLSETYFNMELQRSKSQSKSQYAKQFKSVCNNDHHGMRFGYHQIGVEHIMTIRLYCNNSKLCTDFRQSFYAGNDIQHYRQWYWFGRFLHETVQFLGKEFTVNRPVYIGLNRRVLLPSMIVNWCLPVSCTDELDIATDFATKYSEHGVILELTNLWNNVKLPRYHRAEWISMYNHEKELIYCEYHDTTTMVKNMHIWIGKWITLEFEIFALNYWSQITMGYVGNKRYNLQFNKRFKRKRIQCFLGKLCEFEMNDNKKISDIKSDKFRFVQRQFHNILINRKGDGSGDIFCDINFMDIQNEKIYCSLAKYLYGTNVEDKVICVENIKKLYPNMKGYIDQNGKLRDKNGKLIHDKPLKLLYIDLELLYKTTVPT